MRSLKRLGKHITNPKSEGNVDRISSLPDELLGQVLSLLSTTCAVSTSVLSTRWRYLFTLSDCLSFDDAPDFGDAGETMDITAAQQRGFKKFVHRVLELHQLPTIKIFSLECVANYDKADLNAWVSYAVEKGVQELHYRVLDQKVELPDSLFMCETLMTLKLMLYMSKKTRIPLSTRLPKLKILHLDGVDISDYNSVKSLLCGCELLEELALTSCSCDIRRDVVISFGLLKALAIENCYFWGGLLAIDAPNLAYLTYSSNNGVKIAPSWKDSCSLVKAHLEFSQSIRDGFIYDHLLYDCELLKAAAYKVTDLCFLEDSVELLLTLVGHKQMPEFRNLTRVRIPNVPYDLWKYVTSLLESSPQLDIVISKEGLSRRWYDPMSPPSEALNPFSCHAKVIELHEFDGNTCALLLLGHLLRNTKVLKRLIVHIYSCDGKEKKKIRKNLLMLPRASRDCCIEINGELIP